ncbi:Vesicle-associated membrane protein 4 [Coemansia sp. RSA 1286]|nr:Vesicle-associated membrane protein 4 [Coemansia sp. RSA 1286]
MRLNALLALVVEPDFYAHNAAGYSFSSNDFGASNAHNNMPGASFPSDDDHHDADGRMGKPNNKATAIQQQVDEVVDIMNDNVKKITDRQERLNQLGDKTSALQETSSRFRKEAKTAHRNMWWQNKRLTIIIAIIVIIIIVVIVGKCGSRPACGPAFSAACLTHRAST